MAAAPHDYVASVLKRPIVVVRRSTQRPEMLGTFARLVQVGDKISFRLRLPEDIDPVDEELAEPPSPHGDGSASCIR